MKRFLCCTGLLVVAATLCAQQQPPSPPETATGTIGGKSITIAYSSPRVKGRAGHIFGPGGLISHNPHYPVWRGGANAATTLKADANLKIGDIDVPAGTYTLFVDISDPDNWKLIVNKKTGEWGLAYDKSADLGETPMTMSTPPSTIEDLKYTIADSGGGKGTLTLEWENHVASVPISAE
ncbi:MAG: DUF2911 domain-containing protein [Terracidiphilus sp.]